MVRTQLHKDHSRDFDGDFRDRESCWEAYSKKSSQSHKGSELRH